MEIQIQVFSNIDALQSRKVLFERIISVHDSISIPYQSLVDDLKFLFGSTVVVTFNVH